MTDASGPAAVAGTTAALEASALVGSTSMLADTADLREASDVCTCIGTLLSDAGAFLVTCRRGVAGGVPLLLASIVIYRRTLA